MEPMESGECPEGRSAWSHRVDSKRVGATRSSDALTHGDGEPKLNQASCSRKIASRLESQRFIGQDRKLRTIPD